MTTPILWLVATFGCLTPEPDGPPPTDSDPTSDPDSEPTEPSSTSSTSTETRESSPQILSLATSSARITEAESVLITAIVTDPDGIDDLIGGQLSSESGEALGVFATGAQEGAYQVTVTWDQLIPDAIYGDTEVIVVPRFYDVAGNSVSDEVVVTLWCEGGAACDGRCTDVTADAENCGICGEVCDELPEWGEPVCHAGACVAETACFAVVSQNCEQACSLGGLGRCVDIGSSGGLVGIGNDDPGCSVWGYTNAVPTCTTEIRSLSRNVSAYCFCEP